MCSCICGMSIGVGKFRSLLCLYPLMLIYFSEGNTVGEMKLPQSHHLGTNELKMCCVMDVSVLQNLRHMSR